LGMFVCDSRVRTGWFPAPRLCPPERSPVPVQ
jgi:hypothetical protein